MKKYIYFSLFFAVIVSLVFIYYMVGNKYIALEDIKRNIQLYENTIINIEEVEDIGNEKYFSFSSKINSSVGFAVYTKKMFYNKFEYVASDKTSFELSKKYLKVPNSNQPHTLVVYGKNTNENIAYYKISINGQDIVKDISNEQVFMDVYRYALPASHNAKVIDVTVYDKFYNYIGTR
ncbi:hypothetical protein IMX26_16200 [Clostridium sp. 'deep sea']|uniref:hypothetical protein n=1 Tax=Clostridium sp. 'deep sea' TaxID=2779445 RepID=UPI0018968DAE|nr:hypothetical protein [Clostridium sp. 'deep sea']QOR34981.1 hypothetical protein IMX26_16200 [Clostridium sp. 'deep sea']